jgi:hypothetical protein
MEPGRIFLREAIGKRRSASPGIWSSGSSPRSSTVGVWRPATTSLRPARAWTRRASAASLTPTIRPSPMAWAWGSRSPIARASGDHRWHARLHGNLCQIQTCILEEAWNEEVQHAGCGAPVERALPRAGESRRGVTLALLFLPRALLPAAFRARPNSVCVRD